ncbi:hypothetical protein [Polyangium spumosum]|uniref:Tetratricopeptide repeat protein n=1 Tax=Polyangium spumosum TaxID=889282 RepID=A0A6N7PT37_9BACT|nr:hypothetical protein [Polyangium spumosum]MRG95198.1 hypothetical protein [Polyangium spumosum]
MRRLGALLVSSLLLFVAAGCGGYLGSAQRAYQDGRYLEVAEELGEHEGEVARLSPRKQVSYGLYLGLSLLMLGDRDGAERWLAFAEEIEARQPGTLRPDEKRELEVARVRLASVEAEDKAKASEEPAEDGTLLQNVRQTEP